MNESQFMQVKISVHQSISCLWNYIQTTTFVNWSNRKKNIVICLNKKQACFERNEHLYSPSAHGCSGLLRTPHNLPLKFLEYYHNSYKPDIRHDSWQLYFRPSFQKLNFCWVSWSYCILV